MANFLSKLFGSKKLQESLENESAPRKINIQLDPVGSSGTEFYGGYVYEEYLQALLGSQRANIFDQMRRSDPKIKMILSAVKNPIKGAKWDVTPVDSSEAAKKQAEFVKHVLFNDLSQTFQNLLSEILTMIEFGHSVFEVTHKVVIAHPKFGTYNGIKSLGFRSQKTLERFNVNKDGSLCSVTQQAFGDLQKLVDIPGQFLVVFTLDKEGDNYEGISGLRPCYGPWKRKDKYLKLMAIGIEKFAVPTPLLHVPEGQENSDKYSRAVQILQQYVTHEKQYITIPFGWEIELTQNTFDSEKVRTAIDAENVEMVHAFLANFLELGQSGSGSYALSFDLSDFFLSGIEHIAKQICETINSDIITPLIKLNYGAQESYPKMNVTGISDRAGKELAEVIKMLIEGKVIVPDDELEKSMRERFGLPVASDEGKRELVDIKQIQTEKVDSIGAPKTTQPVGPDGKPLPENQPFSNVALNGAQVTSLVDLIAKVAIGAIPRESALQIITTAFNVEPDQADKMLGPIGEGFKPTVPPEQSTKQFAEAPVKGTPKDLIESEAAKIKGIMQSELKVLSSELSKSLLSEYKKDPKKQLTEIKEGIPEKKIAAYKETLMQTLADTAVKSLAQVRKEVPGKESVKAFENLDSIKLADIAKLPEDVRKKVIAQAGLIVDGQVSDLSKAMSFTYNSAVGADESESQIESDLNESADKFIAGPSVNAGAGNSASYTVNTSRNEFFFDEKVFEDVKSFTFVNNEPVSPICQDLAGTVFSKDDPNLDAYSPPLHHNCKSYLAANYSDTELTPGGLTPSSKDLDKYITLAEESKFVMQSISISKKKAATLADAQRLALEFGAPTNQPTEKEDCYTFTVKDPGLFVEGTLRELEAMEGILLYYGMLKPVEEPKPDAAQLSDKKKKTRKQKNK